VFVKNSCNRWSDVPGNERPKPATVFRGTSANNPVAYRSNEARDSDRRNNALNGRKNTSRSDNGPGPAFGTATNTTSHQRPHHHGNRRRESRRSTI